MARTKYGTGGDERYYSELYGDAVYEQTGVTGDCWAAGREDRWPFAGAGEGESPILTNVKTGEEVFLRRLELERGGERGYFRRILDPPRTERILWPVDLIRLGDGADCSLFTGRNYAPETVQRRAGRYAVALPRPAKGLADSVEALRRVEPRNWKNRTIQAAAVQAAVLIGQLNREGYSYHDFHPSRLCFAENGRLFLDYSDLCCSLPGWIEDADAFLRTPGKNRYPLEWGDPAMVRGIIPALDTRSQNYSLSAFLFWLLFGRCPCDGGLLSGYPDDNPYNHYAKFQAYHKMPVFLFDPADDSNAPGAFEEDTEILSLWAECPAGVRERFTRALSRESAERRGTDAPPEAVEWLEAFREAGWTGRPG